MLAYGLWHRGGEADESKWECGRRHVLEEVLVGYDVCCIHLLDRFWSHQLVVHLVTSIVIVLI